MVPEPCNQLALAELSLPALLPLPEVKQAPVVGVTSGQR